MVKPKQRHIRRAPRKKHQNEGSQAVDSSDEGDWMVVKKQKITILIPPLPNKVIPTMPNVGEAQLQEKPRSTNSQPPRATSSASKESVHETHESLSSSPKQDINPPAILHPSKPNITIQKPCHRIDLDNYGMGIGKCSASKGNKGMMIFAGSRAFPDRRMRASYLEIKLKKAGGLENWLVSLGLGHFVKVFQRRSVNKFQLANLTMKKLQDMGTDAVGPRRKLMHAIDCLCEPHCFQHV
ncbi:hypothetical protein DH2020_026495 [Rehmannia glutinosa]|uniref:SAM domain-containing protein n=1 Tax=Rehmannia glutinosa TaxID=99300 RepID=A0ABR0W0S1_REHGL